ncbi:hypothetical protein EV201_0902 [Ancylomarina subtilis]|uniref:Uncharacterized protein n=1 Tax=Ancylomarina subtilis TaxID=1639035 RepID=A0A4Q7VJA0_9BACT|nr:hypothetical protein EV201_0902 [Ancylomarina subtilis]
MPYNFFVVIDMFYRDSILNTNALSVLCCRFELKPLKIRDIKKNRLMNRDLKKEGGQVTKA